jgi:hypothetical protein
MRSIRFKDCPTQPTTDYPKPERLVTGNPARTTWNHYSDPTDSVHTGVWASEAGSWRIEYPANRGEFFHLLEGEIALTDAAGTRTVYTPGDSCIIPPGFTGLFEVVRAAKKHYVLWDFGSLGG